MQSRAPRPELFAPVVFARPWPLASLLLLVVNDHVLKGAGALPGWLTGKLSDFSGLFFFPVLLAYLGGRLSTRRQRVAQISVFCTGLLFALLKLSPGAAAMASRLWGVVVCDPSDLLALPALLAAYLYLRRPATGSGSAGSPWLQRGAVLAAAWASIATSPAPRPPFVSWQIQGRAVNRAGCGQIAVWIAKSGKTGVGIGIARVDGTGESPSCQLALQRATLEVGGHRIEASAQLPGMPIESRDRYLPFLFDNEAAWNAGDRAAVLLLELSSTGERAVVRVPLLQAWQRGEPPATPAPPPPTPSRAPGPLFVVPQDDAGTEPTMEEAP